MSRRKMRRVVVGALLAVVCCSALAKGNKIVDVYADDSSKLMWYQADLQGFPVQKAPDVDGVTWGTQQWTRADQTVTWHIDVAESADYAVSLMYLCPAGSGGSDVEVSVVGNEQKVTGRLHETG